MDLDALDNQYTGPIWKYLIGYLDDYGYPPATDEYVKAGVVSSPSMVHRHLGRLEEAGLIERVRREGRQMGRGVRLSPEAKEMLDGEKEG